MLVDKESKIPNTLSISSSAHLLCRVKNKYELLEVWKIAKDEKLPILPVGEGSNIIPRSLVRALVVILDFKGIEKNGNFLHLQAGEKWDKVVEFAVNKNLSGIEALSSIPGLVGAAPVQNIGAYGTEIGNVISEVEVFDAKDGKFKFIKNEECRFRYRSSIFKNKSSRYIITAVTLNLKDQKPNMPKYNDVINYFAKRNIKNPSLFEIRNAIISIREGKLPDPYKIPNAGSFFTNPILSKKEFEGLKNKFPDLPSFEIKNKNKIPAGWLIESVGLKGKQVGKLKVYDKNALVLTNPSHANFEEIIKAEEIIKNYVLQKFNILLEREPIVI